MTDSPYDKLIAQGAHALTPAELLAVLLRSGSGTASALDLAQQILDTCGGLRPLSCLQYADLIGLLSPNQAVQVLAVLELARRLNAASDEDRPQIRGAADAARLLSGDMEALKQEHFRTILLDVHRRVMAVPTVYIGSLQMTVVRAAEVFREAITRNCASLILVHNHPSGDPTPSIEDVNITEALIAAGRVLDIGVLDHVIIGQGRWVSLRDTGVKF